MSVTKRKNADNAETPSMKKQRIEFCDTVNLLVGSDEEVFTIHLSKLPKAGLFFAAAVKNVWRKQEPMIKFPGADTEAFRTLMHWVYTDEIITKQSDGGKAVRRSETVEAMHLNSLLDLYSLSQFFVNIPLCNRVIDILIDTGDATKLADLGMTSRAMGSLPSTCGLARLIARQWLCVSKTELDKNIDRLPSDIVILIAQEGHKYAHSWVCVEDPEDEHPKKFHDKED